jgi:hypothetical protein
LYRVGTVLRFAHRLFFFHVLRVEAHTILGDKPSGIPHHGCKQNTLAAVKLQTILLTLLENEIESSKQVIFCCSMGQAVIQQYFDVALDVVHHDN